MRFCLVSTQEHWGGGEALLCSIAQQLQQAGHAVSWIARRDSEVIERIQRDGAEVLHELYKRGTNLRDWFATRRSLRKWVPDVLLLNDTHAVPLAGSVAWFCRRPRPLRLAYKHTVFPLRSGLKYRLLSDKLICVSAAAQETVVAGGLPREHTAVVYGGCPLPVESRHARERIRRELQLTPEQKLLVCVGNLLDCKGHAELVAAAQVLHNNPSRVGRGLETKYSEFVIVIAGEGAERERLTQRINDAQLTHCVRLLGYRNDAEQLLAAADLVVHPSHAEGLSLVLIQAQMLAKPIVATAVGGAAEVLQSSNVQACTSWIAEPKNAFHLAQQITSALACLESEPDLLARRLQETKRHACEKFDIGVNAHLLVELSASNLAYSDSSDL
ncbi:MAG: glycosyltransferase [Pirellulaceae bacterium]